MTGKSKERGYVREAERNEKKLARELRTLESELENDTRQFWGHVKEINNLFKTLKPLRQRQREELWNKLGQLCTRAKEKMAKQSKANAAQIKEGLDRIEQKLNRQEIGDFWGGVSEVNTLFKTLKPLNQDDRKRLWNRLSRLCEEAKKQQEREKRHSRQKAELVEDKIREVVFLTRAANDHQTLNQARERLNTALDWMKKGWEGFNVATEMFEEMIMLNNGVLLQEDREKCWEKWKSAKQAIQYKYRELCRQDYNQFKSQAYNILEQAASEPKEAKRRVKQTHQELSNVRLAKQQANEIYKILDQAWEKASRILDKQYEDREGEWLDQMRSHISRWNELLEKNRRIIADLERQIDECEEMAASAQTEEFATKVRGWIEEKYRKIQDIEQTNRELEEKIHSVNRKIRN
ncbi:MAG: hypothetical protein ACOC4Z_02770 [Patescibacteria group bacterium]